MKDSDKVKQYLEHPTSRKIYTTNEMIETFTTDDAIILSTLIRICHRKLIPGTVLDDVYYAASNAKQLHECFFAFWTWNHFVDTFVPLLQAGLISMHRLPSPYLTDRSAQTVHYAPNYSGIYQAVMWCKNK